MHKSDYQRGEVITFFISFCCVIIAVAGVVIFILSLFYLDYLWLGIGLMALALIVFLLNTWKELWIRKTRYVGDLNLAKNRH